MKERFGFVYIWYDKKRKMFYIGCHTGNFDDGYICSSRRMRKAYRRRPTDFKRRILSSGVFIKSVLLDEEYKWLSLIKEHELNKKYYNARNTRFGHWSETKDFSGKNHPMYGKKHTEESLRKISESGKGREPWNKGKTGVYSEERMAQLKEAATGNTYMVGRKHSEESKEKMSESHRGLDTWNKGKTGVYSEESLRKMSESSKGQIAWNKGKKFPQLCGDNNGGKKYKGKTWYIDKETGKRVWVNKEE